MPPDYHLIQPIQAQLARFSFHGIFQDRPIQWQAELLTLSHYYELGLNEGLYAPNQTVSLQQFIEISLPDIEPLPIRIVHAIPEVNQASMLKTIIMVRNYKRLHRGRHTYGAYFEFGTQNQGSL
ncbi:MAG: hypothetical protein OEX12_01910 [Gammaproteobacteria bacterium]|nr:hypothetical protein [Gammaproteobacteria bacterium]